MHIKYHEIEYIWGEQCLINEMKDHNGCIRHCKNPNCMNKSSNIQNKSKIIYDPKKHKILLNKQVFCTNKYFGKFKRCKIDIWKYP